MASNTPRSLWLDRYTDPLPIRSRGAFHLVSARRRRDGAPCAVVVPGPSADTARVAMALGEVERVHALVDHPLIPASPRAARPRGHPSSSSRATS